MLRRPPISTRTDTLCPDTTLCRSFALSAAREVSMTVYKDTLALIGNTPLVRLKGPSEATGCDIFGKCEFAQLGASVKDRAALYIVKDAEEKQQQKPGGIIVEGTAGKTGIGRAVVPTATGTRTNIM